MAIALLQWVKWQVQDLNDDDLYEIFDFVIKEMNIRKTKELVQVQKALIAKKANEVYRNATRV